jgi:hypothetical protein
MPVLKCPVAGFEEVEITLPARWLIRHNEQFWTAFREAGDVSQGTAQLFGCVAVIEKIEGLEASDPLDWPLELFGWVRDAVWPSLEKALYPPKN